ncbi:MAG: protein kinase [Mycobacteriales bacterium]
MTLGGRYRLVDRIAVGGMGEVWAARDILLERDVAVKLLKAEYLEHPGFLARFRAEARHTAGLSHPGIASVYDYGEINGAPYLVMELVAGEPLSAVLARTGALPVSQALDIAAQTARALGAAHAAGVVHRDVKPGNILVRPDGVVKVTDFGIARAVDAVPLTQTGTVVGTASYLSPEQAEGKPTGPGSDLYSLGVVTYEMVAGYRPFAAENPVAIALAHLRDQPEPLPEQLPEPVRALIMRALEKDPAARHADASEFAADAEHAGAVTSGSLPAGELPASTSMRGGTRGGRTLVMRTGVMRTGVMRTGVIRTPAASAPVRLRGHRRIWSAAAAALAVLLLVIVAANAMSGDTKRAGGATPTASSSLISSSPAPTAAGTSTVKVPANLAGLTYEQAATAVTKAGLKPVRRDVTSAAGKGIVVSAEPAAATPLAPGATVTLSTSSGPPAPVVRDAGRGKKKGRGRDD